MMEEARNLNAEKVEDLVDLCRRSNAVFINNVRGACRKG